MSTLTGVGELLGVARDENGVDTLTCECGHTEPLNDDGTYQFIPTGWWRWQIDPATSTVSQVEQYRYICDPCFAQLPEE